jgi:hypothetical protein
MSVHCLDRRKVTHLSAAHRPQTSQLLLDMFLTCSFVQAILVKKAFETLFGHQSQEKPGLFDGQISLDVQ